MAAAAALSSAEPAAGVSALALDLDRPDSGLTCALALSAFAVSAFAVSAFAPAFAVSALAVSDLAVSDFLARLPPLGAAVAVSSLAAACRAAAKVSFLSDAGALVRRVPSAPGSPLNFCQSPVILRMTITGSVGCAPTDSQCCARSELTSMKDGSSFGWYLPISSMARPSRLVRASATTIR